MLGPSLFALLLIGVALDLARRSFFHQTISARGNSDPMFGLGSALRRFDPAAGLRLRFLSALCEVNAAAFGGTATSSHEGKVSDISLCAGASNRHGVMATTSASGQ